MAPPRLTAQIAFSAALELTEEYQEVNSNTLWLRCGGIGSRGTAKKWAELWKAFEEAATVDSKFEKYRPVYEAIRTGEPVDCLEPGEVELIPQVKDAVMGLVGDLSAVVEQVVAERSRELGESSAAVVQLEQERSARMAKELERVRMEFAQVQEGYRALEENYKGVVNDLQVLQGRYGAVVEQLTEQGRQLSGVEGQRTELAEKYGQTCSRVVELEQGLRVANQRCDELEELCTGLRDEVRQGREREVECSQRCAVLQVQWEEVKRQFEAGQSQRGELEAEVRSLHGLLLEKEGRAATAEERARQFEAQVEALRGEVAALTKERKRSN